LDSLQLFDTMSMLRMCVYIFFIIYSLFCRFPFLKKSMVSAGEEDMLCSRDSGGWSESFAFVLNSVYVRHFVIKFIVVRTWEGRWTYWWGGESFLLSRCPWVICVYPIRSLVSNFLGRTVGSGHIMKAYSLITRSFVQYDFQFTCHVMVQRSLIMRVYYLYVFFRCETNILLFPICKKSTGNFF